MLDSFPKENEAKGADVFGASTVNLGAAEKSEVDEAAVIVVGAGTAGVVEGLNALNPLNPLNTLGVGLSESSEVAEAA